MIPIQNHTIRPHHHIPPDSGAIRNGSVNADTGMIAELYISPKPRVSLNIYILTAASKHFPRAQCAKPSTAKIEALMTVWQMYRDQVVNQHRRNMA